MDCSSSKPCVQARRTRNGFTLIELTAVIVVVAILSAVTVPVLTDLSHSRQSAGAAQVLRDIHGVRQQAVARGQPCWIVFDVDADTYSIFVETAESPGRNQRIQWTDPVLGNDLTVDLSQGIFAGAGLISASFADSTEVGFDFLGRPLDVNERLLQADGNISFVGGRTLIVVARTGHAYLSR